MEYPCLKLRKGNLYLPRERQRNDDVGTRGKKRQAQNRWKLEQTGVNLDHYYKLKIA